MYCCGCNKTDVLLTACELPNTSWYVPLLCESCINDGMCEFFDTTPDWLSGWPTNDDESDGIVESNDGRMKCMDCGRMCDRLRYCQKNGKYYGTTCYDKLPASLKT